MENGEPRDFAGQRNFGGSLEMTKENEESCPAHSGVNQRLANLEGSDSKQWEAIEKLRMRLPVWATLVISLLTFGLGASMTYATFAVRLAEAINTK